MTDLSDISPRQCCFFGWAQTLCHKQPLLFSKQAGKKKKKKDGGFAAAGIRTLWLLSLWKKKGKGKEEVGIDLQEDGHLSVCTFVLKLEGEREKKKSNAEVAVSTKLEEDIRYFSQRYSSAHGDSWTAICRFRKIMLFIVAYACALYRLLTEPPASKLLCRNCCASHLL